MGDDAARLAGYVETWWQAIDDFTHVLEAVPADAWSTPTDLPGWDVHAVAAHTARRRDQTAAYVMSHLVWGQTDQPRNVTGRVTAHRVRGSQEGAR